MHTRRTQTAATKIQAKAHQAARRDGRGHPPSPHAQHSRGSRPAHTHTHSQTSVVATAPPRVATHTGHGARSSAPGRRSRARPRQSRSHTTAARDSPQACTAGRSQQQDGTRGPHIGSAVGVRYIRIWTPNVSTAQRGARGRGCTASRACARPFTVAASLLSFRVWPGRCQARDYRPRSRCALHAGRAAQETYCRSLCLSDREM